MYTFTFSGSCRKGIHFWGVNVCFCSYLVNKPCWLEGCTYVLSYVLLISPILRLIYWICSKSAEVEVVKVFKTQGGIEESSFTRPPSPWRIPLNSEDKPFKDNLQSFDIRQGWSYAHMKS